VEAALPDKYALKTPITPDVPAASRASYPNPELIFSCRLFYQCVENAGGGI
jgi:hypothetical protein